MIESTSKPTIYGNSLQLVLKFRKNDMNSTAFTQTKRKKRLANIELLRILAMVLIVANHFTGHGLKLMDYEFDNPCSIFNWLVRGIGYMGTNLFILISAYFLCKSNFKSKGLLLLWAQTLFYSVILYLITYILGWHSLDIKGVALSFIPLISSQYWFVTCYAALYILSPFLNKFIEALVIAGERVYLTFCFVLLLFFSVIPSFFYFSQWINWGGSSGIVWFVVLYFIGGYIRNFLKIDEIKVKKEKVWIVTIILWCLPLISKLIIAYTTNFVFGTVIGSSIFYVKNSIILVPASIMTFIAFFTFDIKNEKIVRSINWIASGIFSVYLIHDNGFVREHLWRYVVRYIHPDSYSLIYETFIVIISIFCVCLLIDIIRKYIFKLLGYTSLPQKLTSRIVTYIDSKMKI